MQRPTSVNFTNWTLAGNEMSLIANAGIPNHKITDWTRLVVSVPVDRDSMQHVQKWLFENCSGQFVFYKYQDGAVYTEYKMVIRFENKNDALLFKLKDGHRAWEQAQQ